MWGAVAIAVLWLAVLSVGVFSPNIVVNNSSGYSNVPVVVVVVVFFALLGTIAVARRAFRTRRDQEPVGDGRWCLVGGSSGYSDVPGA
jgi:hypothetical protein